MVITVKARFGSREMERLNAACQRAHVGWYDACRWLDNEAQRAAQSEVLAAIERLATASPEQLAVLSIDITSAGSGKIGHECQASTTV